ncbi:uncharacterized protein LOC126896864 [Daktulosphaira vitifoliae]|uniref:uncharacterized protein LOC126896864 n=1 Tax=Daktulosphaira vitifoliae TaxID=58002 RepID=UPI0021AA9964|nr:uncharacterized protein LOC126896864 [Daktulosphaira vitifoliae]
MPSIKKKSTKTIQGRPLVDLTECSERTMRRKINSALTMTSMTSPEILCAAKKKLFVSGKRNETALFNKLLLSPNSVPQMKMAIKDSCNKEPISYTADEALAFIVDNQLTKQQYMNIRLGAKKRNCDIYPSYEKIFSAKQKCYPDNVKISESGCIIPLQNLLDHTTKRIFQIPAINEVKIGKKLLEMFYKWGCDGSSGQAQYKQKFNDNPCTTDQTMFMFSLVPLELRCCSDDSNDSSDVIWKNSMPSSTRFCRPIKYKFMKETIESTKEEVKEIEKQISKLNTTYVLFNDEYFEVKHTLIFSMVDGKVCNSLTGISSQKCFICGCKPTEMNDIEAVKYRPCITENYKYGLSTLHAWIRFFEYFIHLSYRLEIKTWQVKAVNKGLYSVRKQHIQNKFRSEMGLLVDIVLQGHGTTNDGNTARKFFKNAELSSSCTGIDINLIKRCGTILSVIASGYTINIKAFEEYCFLTAKLFVSLYPWYYMPASVHKILLHGAHIIQYAPLPIGNLSEEAQESRNKDYKMYREHHTRKNSRLNTNEDLIHILLISSDPYISCIDRNKQMHLKELSEDGKMLVIFPHNDNNYKEDELNSQLNDSFSDMNLSMA